MRENMIFICLSLAILFNIVISICTHFSANDIILFFLIEYTSGSLLSAHLLKDTYPDSVMATNSDE